MVVYSPEFQSNIVKKILSSPNKTITSIAKEENISKSTIYKWLNQHKNTTFKLDETDPCRPSDWEPSSKLKALQESFNLDGEELNSYCRKNGIYAHHLDEWRNEFMTSKKDDLSAKQKSELKLLKHKIKQLTQELNRKDKALAETAALLVLKKKANLIWGEDEED
jgi:transposase